MQQLIQQARESAVEASLIEEVECRLAALEESLLMIDDTPLQAAADAVDEAVLALEAEV